MSELATGAHLSPGAAVRLGISAYDAHFVVVAEKLEVPLVTHDRELLERCPHQTVSMLRYARGA